MHGAGRVNSHFKTFISLEKGSSTWSFTVICKILYYQSQNNDETKSKVLLHYLRTHPKMRISNAMKCPDKRVEKKFAKEKLLIVYFRWGVSA